jgi:1-acyl-sn-glycerol-3-phosphate acyltransferase
MFKVDLTKIRDSLSWYLPRQLTDTEKLISREALFIVPIIAFCVNIFRNIFMSRYRASGSTAELAVRALRLCD